MYNGQIDLHLNKIPCYEFSSSISAKTDRVRLHFTDLEHAAFALAAFKRNEDVPVIKDLLLNKFFRMDETSFLLMKKFPDTSYLEVLQKFSERSLRMQICENGNAQIAPIFFQTVASYQNQTAANILSAVLNRKHIFSCAQRDIYLRRELMTAIRENNCPAFSNMNTQLSRQTQ